MLNKHEHKEELVRDRYDQVVNKLDRERKEQIDKLLEEMRQVQIKIDDMVRFIARPMR
jgi:RecB family exonuclease